jgi:hypothetical protein
MEKELSALIDAAVDQFTESVPLAERSIFKELEKLLRALRLNDGNVAKTVSNLRLVSRIQGQLENLVIENPKYEKSVIAYMDSFGSVNTVQNAYFKTISDNYAPSEFLKLLQNDSVEATLQSLTRGGISANVIEPIGDLLRENVRVGIDYGDMVQGLRDYIVGNDTVEGRLSRYVKQMATDSLNQYSAGYTEVVAADLKLDWFQYTGSLLVQSRAFCKAMVNKRYYHRKEVPLLIHGKFPEFKSVGGTLNSKTNLPDGMNPVTNAANFTIYRGGFNCRHQAIPVTEGKIPKKIRVETYTRLKIPFDSDGFALKKAA